MARYAYHSSIAPAASLIAAPYWSPLNLVVAPIMWLDPAFAYEEDGVGTGVSYLLDQGPNSYDASQVTLAARPTLSATGGPDGSPCIRSLGAGWLLSEWTPVQPYTIAAIVRQDSYVNSAVLCGGQSTTRACIRNTTANHMIGSSGSNGANATVTPNVWQFISATFSNSAADHLTLGDDAPAAGPFGANTTDGGLAIMALKNGTGLGQFSIGPWFIFAGTSLPAEPEFMEYLQALYPSVEFP